MTWQRVSGGPYKEAHRVKTAEELAQEGDDAQLAMEAEQRESERLSRQLELEEARLEVGSCGAEPSTT
jgi:hypothetical protein